MMGFPMAKQSAPSWHCVHGLTAGHVLTPISHRLQAPISSSMIRSKGRYDRRLCRAQVSLLLSLHSIVEVSEELIMAPKHTHLSSRDCEDQIK